MSKDRSQWNRPGYPWELELITLCFFLMSLFVPYYLHHYGAAEATVTTQAAHTPSRTRRRTGRT